MLAHNEAETIYKLVLEKNDVDLAVYMAKRLEQQSNVGAWYIRYVCKTKPQFKRAFNTRNFAFKEIITIEYR